MKTKLLLLTIAISAKMMAQPTLTAVGINPVVGDTYNYSDGVLTSPGTSGANQTWNFAGGDTSTWDIISTPPFSSAPSSAKFTNANIVLKDYSTWGDFSFSYYKTSNNAFQEYGKVQDAGNNNTFIEYNYSNPIDVLHFPFTYNDSYTDSFSGVGQGAYMDSANNFSVIDSVDFYSGNLIVTADAYGTLITNTGTYNNVIRIHTIKHTRDSSLDATNNYSLVEESYTWYENNTHTYLASYIKNSNSADTTTLKYFTYLSVYNTGVKDVNKLNDFVSVYPNPTNSMLTLSVPTTINGNIKITNITGNEVANYYIQNTNSKTIDIAHLVAGVYFVTVKSDEGVVTKKIMKTN